MRLLAANDGRVPELDVRFSLSPPQISCLLQGWELIRNS